MMVSTKQKNNWFLSVEARKLIKRYNGIPVLVNLLSNEDATVARNAAFALGNSCYNFGFQ